MVPRKPTGLAKKQVNDVVAVHRNVLSEESLTEEGGQNERASLSAYQRGNAE